MHRVELSYLLRSVEAIFDFQKPSARTDQVVVSFSCAMLRQVFLLYYRSGPIYSLRSTTHIYAAIRVKHELCSVLSTDRQLQIPV